MDKLSMMKKLGEFEFELNQCVYDVDEDIILKKIQDFIEEYLSKDFDTDIGIIAYDLLKHTENIYKLYYMEEYNLDDDIYKPLYDLINNLEILIRKW